MRVVVVLLFSFILHLLLFSVDNYLFLSSGDFAQMQKIGYAVRSADSFLPMVKQAVAPPEKKIIQKKQIKKVVKKTTHQKRSVVKPQVAQIEHVVADDSLKKTADKKKNEVALQNVIPPAVPVDLLVEESSPEIEQESDEELLIQSEVDVVLDVELTEELTQPLQSGKAVEPQSGAASDANVRKTTGADTFQSASPRYDINPRPDYPRVARSRGWEGIVLFDVLVLEDGRVGQLEIISSSGYRSLDNAAKRVLRRWKFVPATTLGLAVESTVQVPIHFSLKKH